MLETLRGLYNEFDKFFLLAAYSFKKVTTSEWGETSKNLVLKERAKRYSVIPVVDEVAISFKCKKMFEKINEDYSENAIVG